MLNPTPTSMVDSIRNSVGSVTLTESGNFIVFLDLSSADSGYYKIEAQSQSGVTTNASLFLDGTTFPRIKEGDGTTLSLPIGIVLDFFINICP